MRLLAPILAVTTEEIWQRMREEGWVQEPSVHLARWPEDAPSLPALSPEDDARWKTFRGLREVVMKALEAERARQVIGSPLEARVTLVIGDRTLREHCETHRDTLAEAFVVSEVVVTVDGAQTPGAGSGIPGLTAVHVERAPGAKCARCWKHLPSVGSSTEHPQLCDRCVRVVAHA